MLVLSSLIGTSVLTHLLEEGAVALKDDRFSANSGFVFIESGNTEKQMSCVRASIQASYDAVAKWYTQPQEALFSSTILSVNKETYTKMLSQLNSVLLEFQSRMESSQADTLIRFNVQIFPNK